MNSTRLEAFSDGVIAILITIMVLEIEVPHGADWHALREVFPSLLFYLLSFIYLGIYWSNHHHMFQTVDRVTGGVLWANLHLLFWLSLVPFTTSWMGENHFESLPVAVYGFVLLGASIAYFIVQTIVIKEEGPDSRLKAALGRDGKGKMSPVLYSLAIGLAFVNQWIAIAIFVVIAFIWLIPDRRLEKSLELTGP